MDVVLAKLCAFLRIKSTIFFIPFYKTRKANLLKKASPLSEEEILAKDEH